ncbi:MAG: hypothetical protein U5R14_04750 [Gemmatimonadota bacterium]|nr:hypothetical protein [Gemmatimonadota bacterium]
MMREFTDREGRTWTALVREAPATDYKGRYHLVLRPADEPAREYPLEDIRWNSERTGLRTIETMSEVELRRRLRSAVGRGAEVR